MPLLTLSEEIAQLKKLITEQTEKIIELARKLEKAEEKNRWYEEQMKRFRQAKFGKKTETSHSVNLTLFDEQEADEVTETIEPIDDDTERVTYTRHKPKKNGRNIDLSNLAHERVEHDLSDAQKVCHCGCQLHKIGEDTSKQLEYVPATLTVIEHVSFKYGCRQCQTIRQASKPLSAIPKSLASHSLIAEVIIKKYDQHLPLYRQSKILAKEGIDIPDNTLGNWVMGGADALAPLGDAMNHQFKQVRLLQADETPVKILKPDKKGYLWGYHSLDPGNRLVFFEFNLTREAAVPNKRLKEFSGLLQTDGYSGYSDLRQREDIINLGCWDHARRKVMDVIKINGVNKAGLSGQLISLINQLYKLERKYKHSPNESRYQMRQQHAKPLLDKIFSLVRSANALPKSLLGVAITYLRNQQEDLMRYSDHGDTQISNCLMENQIRPFALGRRNWLFVGNEQSANKAALLYSLIQTCHLNGIHARRYLEVVLDHAHAMRRGAIDPVSLLPQFINRQLLEK